MIAVKVLGSGSKGNCYLIFDGMTSLLLDAGLSGKAIQEGTGFALHSLKGCLITHIHSDHARGAKWLARRGIPLYGHASVQEIAPSLEAMEEGKPIIIGTWRVTAFKVEHDAPCYGFFLRNCTNEALVYVTDAAHMPYRFQGVNCWLVEANHSREIMARKLREGKIDPKLSQRIIECHMSIEDLEEYFAEVDLSKTREIWLLHLSDANSDAKDFRERIHKVTGAEVRIA